MFLENGVFTKYGSESSDFFVRNRKKRELYWLFLPIIECSFDRIDVFLANNGHDSSFSWKIWKKRTERRVLRSEIGRASHIVYAKQLGLYRVYAKELIIYYLSRWDRQSIYDSLDLRWFLCNLEASRGNIWERKKYVN